MKKIILLLTTISTTLILGACQKKTAPKESATSTTSEVKASSTTSQKETTVVSTTESQEATITTTSTESEEIELFQKAQADELTSFMKNWEGKDYEAFTPEEDVNFYGVMLPNDLLAGKMKLQIGDKVFQPTWWEVAKPEDFQIVGLYSNANTADFGTAKAYLFALDNGKAGVYETMQNQGNEEGTLAFTPAENSALQEYLQQLINK